MKKLLVGLLALGSLSSFANDDCLNMLHEVSSRGYEVGALESLINNSSETELLEYRKELLDSAKSRKQEAIDIALAQCQRKK